MAQPSKKDELSVYLYIPNIIGMRLDCIFYLILHLDLRAKYTHTCIDWNAPAYCIITGLKNFVFSYLFASGRFCT